MYRNSKCFFMGSIALIAILIGINVNATTTYVKFIINHDTSTHTMTQGDTLGFTCNCGVGDSVRFDYYVDVNRDHIIDAGDKFIISFYLRDGDTAVTNMGYYDNNPTPDGIIYFPGFRDGSAPTNYCVRATDEDNSSAQNYGIVNPLGSPLATVSGIVSVEGINPPDTVFNYLLVGGSKNSWPPENWSAFTDSMGNFKINFGTTGDTFHIGTFSELPGYYTTGDTSILVSGNITGIHLFYKKNAVEDLPITNKNLLKINPGLASTRTAIEYILPEAGKVSLKLYDITGNVIAMLVNGKQTAGHHTTYLATKAFSAGIYFVTLETQKYKDTKKLILVR